MNARPSHPLPDEALRQHIAVLGKTGSGKTSTEKLIVEHVVDSGARVCVLDTLKSDWWGITSSADGKRPGLPFKILGGPRGHVPLHSSAGKAIGQLVGTGKLPLSIIDMADFEAGGVQRFFVDFAQSLWKHARGVVYLVIEEAHELAPKERAGFGAENMSIHWAKKLATGSRTKGIRLMVATQRVQSLHNAVLGSCETLIAHRLTFEADQEPVRKWLKNANKAMADEVADTLASLPDGTGWVCSGQAQLFEKRKFPKFRTYDNTATPISDGEEVDITTAPVDQDELRAIIGDAVKEAEANDPKALKAEIARLKREMAAPTAAAPVVDQHALDEAYEAGKEYGINAGRLAVINELRPLLAKANVIQSEAEHVVEGIGALLASTPAAAPVTKWIAPRPSPARQAPAVRSTPVPRAEGITASLQKILDALAWLEAVGIMEAPRLQVAALADRSPTSGAYGQDLGRLNAAGLIAYPRPAVIALTEAGRVSANAPELPPTTEELHQRLRSKLGESMWRVLGPVIDAYPGNISRKDLAELAGRSPTSGAYGQDLGYLKALGLIDYPSPGVVAALPVLFLEGR